MQETPNRASAVLTDHLCIGSLPAARTILQEAAIRKALRKRRASRYTFLEVYTFLLHGVRYKAA